MQKRNLKVYYSHHSIKDNNSLYVRTIERTVPQIRLQGVWLEELGFNAGDQIEVTCEDGKITIVNTSNKG